MDSAQAIARDSSPAESTSLFGRIIAADWLANAKARSARIAALVQQDKQWLAEEAERAWQAQDAADSEALAQRMVDRLAPALQKAANDECRQLRKDIKRDRKKIEAAGKRIARVKLARFKARRR
jgi:CO/xanthine dehydrogenase FAD-binding subunit